MNVVLHERFWNEAKMQEPVKRRESVGVVVGKYLASVVLVLTVNDKSPGNLIELRVRIVLGGVRVPSDRSHGKIRVNGGVLTLVLNFANFILCLLK